MIVFGYMSPVLHMATSMFMFMMFIARTACADMHITFEGNQDRKTSLAALLLDVACLLQSMHGEGSLASVVLLHLRGQKRLHDGCSGKSRVGNFVP